MFQFAVEPETYMAMYPEFKLPPDQMKAWLARPAGLHRRRGSGGRFGWKIGDKIPIKGTFNRPKGGDGVTWEFNLVGIYDGEQDVDKTQFLFRLRLPDENRTLGSGITGWYLIKVADPAAVGGDREDDRQLFENSSFETKTETEKADGAVVREPGRQHRRHRARALPPSCCSSSC